MTELARAFLAVFPPVEALDALEERLRRLAGHPAAEGVRWVPRGQWHVTARFCGRVADADRLRAELGGALADVPEVEAVQLAGAGAFPTARRGSVLWVGVADGPAIAGLGGIAAAAEGACVAAGLPPDDRAFRPHVTIARVSRARDLRPLVEALGDAPVGSSWTAAEVRLVASDTRPSGAVHTDVARIPLGGGGSGAS